MGTSHNGMNGSQFQNGVINSIIQMQANLETSNQKEESNKRIEKEKTQQVQ